MVTIPFDTTKSSTVYVENGREALSSVLGEVFSRAKQIAVVVDEAVFTLYGNYFNGVFSDKRLSFFVVKGGEKCKTLGTYERIVNFALSLGLRRNDGVIAFGGGSITDVTGFVAATYLRGVTFASVPTTLLAMVDAAIGGKNGIDFGEIKNCLGTFYDTAAVYCDLDFLKTLPPRELESGYGEVIKYAFLGARITADEIAAQTPSIKLVSECIRVKKSFVSVDYKDESTRRFLNLGHTFGHAIESLSGFTLSHGECVLKGLALSLKVAKKLQGLSDENYARAMKLLGVRGHDLSCPYTPKKLETFLKYDKKFDGSAVDFITFDSELNAVTDKLTLSELVGAIR